jgi:hypothetical protein
MEISSTLSLELRRIASLQSSALITVQSDAKDSRSVGSATARDGGTFGHGAGASSLPLLHLGELENASTALGIRLKMDSCPGSYREDRFKEDLCRMLAHRPNFVEMVPRTSHTVQVRNPSCGDNIAQHCVTPLVVTTLLNIA